MTRSRQPSLTARLRDPASHEAAVEALGEEHWAGVISALSLEQRGAVLDVGCFTGAWLPQLARVNSRVVGVDIDEASLSRARFRTRDLDNVEVLQLPAEHLDFPAETFDAVVCLHTFPYLDQRVALGEMVKVVRPGGRLIIGLVGAGYHVRHIAAGLRVLDGKTLRYGSEPFAVALARRVLGERRAAGAVRAWTPRTVGHLCEQYGIAVEHARRAAWGLGPGWSESYLGFPTFFVISGTKLAGRARTRPEPLPYPEAVFRPGAED